MKKEQKQQIITLRRNGMGYGSIASQLGISINTVKSFCHRHSLAAQADDSVCEECGKPIAHNPGRKRSSAAMPVETSGRTHIWSL